jgi:uncharacterized Zn-finger protein
MADGGVMAETRSTPTVTVHADDLPSTARIPACRFGASHPRVYLDVAGAGEAMCPYCGTRYRLEGEAKAGH